MLSRLYIENFALIESAEVEFGPGVNVVTGETGAGKSILLGALDSILGGQVNTDSVRSGEERCVVEGLFEFPPPPDSAISTRLLELGVDVVEEGADGLLQLALRREIRSTGRSRCLANGLVLPLKRLRQIGAMLVDLHGQHEHQSLLDITTHARFLDESGGLADLAHSVADACAVMSQSRDAVSRLRLDRQQLQSEEELRQFQLTEIRDLAPDPAEEEVLERDLKILENQEELARGANDLYQELYQSDASAIDQLARARRTLEQLAETDPSLSARAETLGELVYAVEDLAAGLQQYVGSLDADPERLERSRERLQELRRLKSKYGGSLEAVVALADALEKKELRLGELEGAISAAEEKAAATAGVFAGHCIELSSRRRQAAEVLSSAVAEGLRELGMPDAVFLVGLERDEDEDSPVEECAVRYRADELGMERVEFLISANTGEEPRPLARIASGGEISRVMLVLKEIIAGGDIVSTLVFDEVDVGISGRIAASVGTRLERLGGSHQIIVITHLPQIASLANLHFSVRKRQAAGRTFTEVVELDEAGRKEEIAGLLAGASISDTARQHAQELLE